MSRRWSLKEDIVIFKYCIEKPWAYTIDDEVDMMRLKLEKVGCIPRSIGAIRKRAYAYEILLQRRRLPSIPEQIKFVFNELYFEESSDRSQVIKSYVREVYNPNEKVEDLEKVNDGLPNFDGNANNLLGYQYSIDYKATFPMVLQKYVDLKGVKKHSSMCRKIGMKPDTFSAILRGKYKEVKKDNVLRLCVGLELSVDQAEELLNSAGYMLSNAMMTDVVIKACLLNREYSAVIVNSELYENNVPMLFDTDNIEYDAV